MALVNGGLGGGDVVPPQGSGGITKITSVDSSVTVTDPTGPVTDLSVVASGGITALTGDVTASGSGSVAATLVGTSNVESIITSNATVAGALQTIGGTMSGAIAMGAHKITGLANGASAQDAAAFGQIPTALPPNGAAGGDLGGSYPSPTLVGTSNVEAIISANATVAAAAPLASPTFTGTPAAPTAAPGANTTQLATTAFVAAAVALDLPLAGGTMSGPIAMGAHKITGLANGVSAQDAAAVGQLASAGVVLATPQVFTSSGTWTPSTTGSAIFRALVVGGGGGGGAATATFGGTGGGGGEVRDVYLGNVTGNQTITVGGGGAGASTSGATGSNGTASSIGSLITSNPGLGGSVGAVAGGTPGAGGDGSASIAAQLLVTVGGPVVECPGSAGGYAANAGAVGGPGSSGYNGYGTGGGGGGGATTASGGKSGGSSSVSAAGGSGAALGGGGGAGGAVAGTNGTAGVGGTGANATANTGAGGGGGGAGTSFGHGGNGGSGYVVIYQVA